MGDDPQELIIDLEKRFPKAQLVGADRDFEDHIAQVIGFVENPGIGFDLPLDLRGTAFQQRVWQALREIPLGKTVAIANSPRGSVRQNPPELWRRHVVPTRSPLRCPAIALCAMMVACPVIAGALNASGI